MCGICGIISQNDLTEDIKNVLVKMRDTMVHRGPDEGGVFIKNNVGLAHRRLSIIDLSSGQQPMFSADQNFCIVFNGEIYNYVEIKSYLQSSGCKFKTTSDTEVILQLYMLEGEKCVTKLRGMFAFAIWDQPNHKLFCARDHLGKKPFFYYHSSGFFCFASEIKAILAKGIIRDVNWESIDAYLTFGYIPGDKTAFKGIFKLLPGHTLSYQNNKLNVSKYWDLTECHNQSYNDNEEVISSLQEMFDKSVKDRLMSEVPLGAFLSGGVDSTGVVASMSKQSNGPVTTTTIGFYNKDFDESEIAERSASFYKTNHFTHFVEPDVNSIINNIVTAFDEPFADVSAIPTFYVCQIAKKSVTVALSGDGGDELFGGYNWYDTFLKNRNATSSLLLKFISQFANQIKYPFKGLSQLKSFSMDDWDALLQFRSIYNNGLKVLFYKNDFRDIIINNSIISNMKADFLSKTSQMDTLKKMQYFDFKYYLPDDILVKVDRMSMVNSLEVRAPLLDYKLSEFAWNLPSKKKIHNNIRKYILKEALKPRLPPGLLNYPKKGFTPPVRDWLLGPLKNLVNELLLSNHSIINDVFEKKQLNKLWKMFQSGNPLISDLSLNIWTILMLHLWFKHFFENKS